MFLLDRLKINFLSISIVFCLASCQMNQSKDNSSSSLQESDSKELITNNAVQKYIGTIGTYPVTFFIKNNGKLLSGYMYYDRVGEEIYFSQIDEPSDKMLYFNSFENIEITSKTDNQIKGVWDDRYYLKKNLPVILNKVNNKLISFSNSSFDLKNCDNIKNYHNKDSFLSNSMYDSICSSFKLNILQVNLCNKSVANRINQKILSSTYQKPIQNTKDIQKDYRTNCGEGCENEEKINQSTVFYVDSSLLVVSNYLYNFYFGAAHGNEYYFYLNFDMQTGDTIRFEDIIPKSKRPEFNKVLYSEFKKKYNPADFALDMQNSFYTSENFALNDKGLLMTYNIYEIGAYALGSSTVFIPYSKLKGIISNHKVLEKYKF